MRKILFSFLLSSLLFTFANDINKLCNLLPEQINNYKKTDICHGIKASTPYGTNIQVVKLYKNNQKKIELILMNGIYANQMMSAFMIPMNIETEEMIMKITQCEGFKCAETFNRENGEGSIIVILKNGNTPTLLVLNFKNITLTEAYKILKEIKISCERL